ncbi:MAG: N-acyl-phosphatidylethanolamine-hydrolyzing phospholipase D [Rubritalea sp.]|jgi:N-acyl-phosphatidylethanolamine-hydrolysing phospholipase D
MTQIFFTTIRILIGNISLLFVLSCASANPLLNDPNSPAHHTDEGFQNLYIETPDKTFFSYLKMRYLSDVQWADHEGEADQVPFQPLDLNAVINPKEGLQVSWLGHSTFLIQLDGITLLTDPIFSERSSPFSFVGPKRYVPSVVNYDKLPKIDYVIISHNHYDHLDIETIQHLGNDPIYFVPLKLAQWFKDNGIASDRVREMDWWDKAEEPGLQVQAMPSQHWSARGLSDRYESLWASWHVKLGGRSLWFAGDTGYNDIQFKEIGDKTGGVDFAFIPIGGYLPRLFMADFHINPEEAVKIHQDVKANVSFGMHWGTFPLTAEGPMAPILELAEQIKAYGLDEGEFITLDLGETIRY